MSILLLFCIIKKYLSPYDIFVFSPTWVLQITKQFYYHSKITWENTKKLFLFDLLRKKAPKPCENNPTVKPKNWFLLSDNLSLRSLRNIYQLCFDELIWFMHSREFFRMNSLFKIRTHPLRLMTKLYKTTQRSSALIHKDRRNRCQSFLKSSTETVIMCWQYLQRLSDWCPSQTGHDKL